MGTNVTRRQVIAGAAGLALAGPAAAATPLSELLERSRLGPVTGFVLADAASGAVIEAHQGGMARPPASTAKILTALYALDRLGPAHRFETRLVALGPAGGGRIDGDLALVGGGDPLLDTDGLGDMVAELRAGGVAAVAGALRAVASPPPELPEIEAGQPATAGYNPGVSTLNLNFNRVFLAWAPGGAGPALRLSAPGARFEAPLASFAAEVGGRGAPRRAPATAECEVWAFPAGSLKGEGSLWLPVRAPSRYAGEALQALAGQAGLALPPPLVEAAPVAGATLVRRESQPLEPMLRDMLRYSTNLTAEVTGLAATRAGGAPCEDLAASGAAMTAWARGRYGLDATAALVNHSGLTPRSTMSAAAMARLLVAAAPAGLPGLLRERPLRDGAGKPLAVPGVRVIAKTGTLDFVSALAGYVEGPGERRLAFAIFAADLEARAALPEGTGEETPGARAWARRARAQEQALLRRWIAA